MKILVVGSGAREHALCWKLAQSPALSALYCAPGNGGTAAIAQNVALDPMDFAACADWAERHAIDLTVVGPDDPLGGGIVDVFQACGLRVFGPTRAAARIESSKVWAKRLLLDAGIPTARAYHTDDYDTALAYLARHEAEAGAGAYPLIVKADGLAAGKGVVIARDAAEARAALDAFLLERRLGPAGSAVLIEEYLTGRELSLFALSDGEHVVPLAPACDYKRAYDGDEGPNTGGMGAYSPPAFATPELLAAIARDILTPTVRALRAAGAPFRGLLYAGLMITTRGPYVLEFNARFGDPETQVVLPRLESDLLELCVAVADGRLDTVAPPCWSGEAACGVVIASRGYPGSFVKGLPITGLDALDPDIFAFHAGTRRDEHGSVLTSGGRVLSIVATGVHVAEAREKAYRNVERVTFEGMHYRRDIGAI